MKTAVITTARGRHRHLQTQLRGLARSASRPDNHIIVTMDDPAVKDVVAETGCEAEVVAADTGSSAVPVAQARNVGALAAMEMGAQVLIFLDVDCIPAPDMVGCYRRTAAHERHRSALLCGPVSYLPPPPAGGYPLASLSALAHPHTARPAPAWGRVVESTDYALFWSLSFAVTALTWDRIGGFHTGYIGYGAEDTDFAQLAATRGVGMRWVGGAAAFHQYHSVSDPPVEHLEQIVMNAKLFYQRWGWWPMSGWLRAFADDGLIDWEPSQLRIRHLTSRGGSA